MAETRRRSPYHYHPVPPELEEPELEEPPDEPDEPLPPELCARPATALLTGFFLGVATNFPATGG